jgi:hypothetical protein
MADNIITALEATKIRGLKPTIRRDWCAKSTTAAAARRDLAAAGIPSQSFATLL